MPVAKSQSRWSWPRNAHDDAGAVAHQNVVGDEHRHDLSVGGVDDLDAVEADAGLVLVQLAALEVALAGGGLLIGGDLVPVLDKGLPLLDAADAPER